MTNLYFVLGVRPNATEEEIKHAYRTLAKEHHPDRGGDADRFAQIDAAYQILSNRSKRAQYDAQRAAWLDDVDAVGCPGCGEPNRVRKIPAGKVAICAECKTELPKPQSSKLGRRAAEMGLDLAERGLDHTATLLNEGIDLSFQKLRTGIRERLRGSGKR